MADVIYTKKLVQRLRDAQLKHASALALEAVEHGYSDDGYDYLRGALELARELVDIEYDDDQARFNEMFNTDGDDGLSGIACDGICQEIWDLKPPSLAWLDD